MQGFAEIIWLINYTETKVGIIFPWSVDIYRYPCPPMAAMTSAVALNSLKSLPTTRAESSHWLQYTSMYISMQFQSNSNLAPKNCSQLTCDAEIESRRWWPLRNSWWWAWSKFRLWWTTCWDQRLRLFLTLGHTHTLRSQVTDWHCTDCTDCASLDGGTPEVVTWCLVGLQLLHPDWPLTSVC